MESLCYCINSLGGGGQPVVVFQSSPFYCLSVCLYVCLSTETDILSVSCHRQMYNLSFCMFSVMVSCLKFCFSNINPHSPFQSGTSLKPIFTSFNNVLYSLNQRSLSYGLVVDLEMGWQRTKLPPVSLELYFGSRDETEPLDHHLKTKLVLRLPKALKATNHRSIQGFRGPFHRSKPWLPWQTQYDVLVS